MPDKEGVDATYAPFVYDRVTGALNPVAGAYSHRGAGDAQLSPSGRFVGFSTVHEQESAFGLVSTNTFWRTDLGPTLGGDIFEGSATEPDQSDEPLICIEGTCIPPQASVSFSEATGSDLGDALTARGADVIGAAIAYRPALSDIFVSLELEAMPRTPALAAASAGILYGMTFEADGRPYEIMAASTGLGSRGETTAAFGLFSCASSSEAPCTKVADINGGFGTTGERITFSVPLSGIDLETSGSQLTDVKVFTAFGSYLGVARSSIDQIPMLP